MEEHVTIVVSGFCIYFSPPTGVDSIYTPRHFFAGVEPISFVYLSQWVESRTRQNGAQSINRTYVCCFIAKPLFVLKTWEICFVVDLPAFNVLRQLTKLHVLQNVLPLVSSIHITLCVAFLHTQFITHTLTFNHLSYAKIIPLHLNVPCISTKTK